MNSLTGALYWFVAGGLIGFGVIAILSIDRKDRDPAKVGPLIVKLRGILDHMEKEFGPTK